MKNIVPKIPTELIDPVPALRHGNVFIVMQKQDTLKKPFSDFSPVILVNGKEQSGIIYLGSVFSHMSLEWKSILGDTLEEHNIVLR